MTKQRQRRYYVRVSHPDTEEAEIGGLTAAEATEARAGEIERRDADVRLRRDSGVRLRRPVRIDKDELDAAAAVEFSWRQVVELVDLCTIYRERFRGPPPPDFMLAELPKPTTLTSRAAELVARRAFVEAVEGVWRECRRKRGLGSSYRENKAVSQPRRGRRFSRLDSHDGPLSRLLRKLFEAMGEPNPPGRATLHHDLDFLRGSDERTRGGKRKRNPKPNPKRKQPSQR